MSVLEEAKEIMKRVGCEKVFAVYELKISDIAEVKSYDKEEEFIELEKDVDKLRETIERKLILDREKPIECPLNSSLNKYLEVSLKERAITPHGVDDREYVKIESKIRPLLEKYSWELEKKQN